MLEEITNWKKKREITENKTRIIQTPKNFEVTKESIHKRNHLNEIIRFNYPFDIINIQTRHSDNALDKSVVIILTLGLYFGICFVFNIYGPLFLKDVETVQSREFILR